MLEPISLLTVTVPPGHQGDVMADLTARRGRVSGTDAGEHGEQEIIALVPTSELKRYALDLRSMTAGRGTFTASHDHYDVLPSNLVEDQEGRDQRRHRACSACRPMPRCSRRTGCST